jgi:hypothetical protein
MGLGLTPRGQKMVVTFDRLRGFFGHTVSPT